MKAIKISTTGATEYIEITDANALKTLQGAVGGYVHLLRTVLDVQLVINDDGKAVGLPRNPHADALLHELGVQMHGDFIVGDVVVASMTPVGGWGRIPESVLAELAKLELLPAEQAEPDERPDWGDVSRWADDQRARGLL
jgi:hypothetical protein